MKLNEIILAIATMFSGLMAGLFFAYTFSVVPGLGKLSNIDYLRAMQSINKEIQNPVFFICFFGAIIFLPLITVLGYADRQMPFLFLFSATIIYLAGVFGVSIFGNIPLNNQLEKFNLFTATADAISKQRAAFENRWNFLNNIRTISSIISFILICACIVNKHKSI